MRTTARSEQPQLTVLISGAGIAGATLAGLLARQGHRVTVVECDQGVRSSGNPVDVRGDAYDVVQRMGLLPRLRQAATRVEEVVLVDHDGRQIARIPSRRHDQRDIEIPRADLSAILLEACPPDVELLFDDEITHLDPRTEKISVTFRRNVPRRFDLVVGADGLHSRVRSLLWGPEAEFSRPFGMYVASTHTEPVDDGPRAVRIYNEPARATALHPGAGTAIAAFIFRSEARIDPRDEAAARSLLTATYRAAGWRSPEFLDRYLGGADVYFDAVTRVRVPRWSTGRVTLLGDAASCVSLFGEGSSSAISGAGTLAAAIQTASGNLPAALRGYEVRHRKVVSSRQRGARLGAHLVVPTTRSGIAMRNIGLRLMAAST